jgi:hypothetical protein
MADKGIRINGIALYLLSIFQKHKNAEIDQY